MHDQASDLRELVRRDAACAPTAFSPRPKLLVVAGGKGGVGTTTIAVNLAIALTHQRHRTVLVDAAPHGGDAAMLAGADERHTLADVLRGRRTVRESLQPGAAGLQVLAGAWALGNLPDLSAAASQRLLAQLRELGRAVDFLVVDAGGALTCLAEPFWQAADMVLLVTTPEPASVMDTYARLKLAAPRSGGVAVRTLVNRAPSRSAARDVHRRLAEACRRFLGIDVSGIGYAPDDPELSNAGATRQPFVVGPPAPTFARRVRRLAEAVVRQTRRLAGTP
jgi:flagellar biosynthesis protein FlhG